MGEDGFVEGGAAEGLLTAPLPSNQLQSHHRVKSLTDDLYPGLYCMGGVLPRQTASIVLCVVYSGLLLIYKPLGTNQSVLIRGVASF